jgi:TonB family protein
MILTSLVLIPVLAHAQAGAPTGPKPSPSSATVQAELTQPKPLAEVATAMPAPAAVATVTPAIYTGVREFIQTQMTETPIDAALRQGGTLEYAFAGSEPTESSVPIVTRAVEVDLTEPELAEQPRVTNVAIHATVDAYGYPRNLSVAQSAGAAVDRKALEAISQYRFKPATMDNRPIDAAVTIAIKIEKP